MINGVVITPLKQIIDQRGKIMHMMTINTPVFEKFGEVYFSFVHPGIVKGWHLHREMVLNYAVIQGKIKLVLYDDRSKSDTRGEVMEIFTGPEDYKLITVPANVWNGFQGLGTVTSIVANCASIPHKKSEITRLDPFNNNLPYKWDTSPHQ